MAQGCDCCWFVDRLLAKLTMTLVVEVVCAVGLLANLFGAECQLPIAAGLILSSYAADKRFTAIRSILDSLLEALKRVNVHAVERGDIIGKYRGAPIHSWIAIEAGGERYGFVGSASRLELQPDQLFLYPGLIYRKVTQ